MAASAVGKKRILLVGTGPTAACIYDMLRTHEVAVQVIDKARGIGGRMSTSRSRSLGDRTAGTQPTADLGAQYITSSHEIVKKLVAAGTLQPLSAPIKGQSAEQAAKSNWVAPHGISQLVRELFNGCTPLYEHHLTKLDIVDTELGKAWKASTQSSEQDVPPARAAVLTLPAPQLLQLQGRVQELLQESGVAEKLHGVEYSARFALALWFAPEKAEAVAAAVPGAGMYVDRDSGLDVRFVAHDSTKRGANVPEGEAGVSLVVHSSVSFGKAHVEDSKEDGGAILLEQVKQLLPSLPEADEVKHHKWRYSQVMTPYGGADAPAGNEAIVLCEDPLLILAGDSFTASNLDGCISSAEAAVAKLTQK